MSAKWTGHFEARTVTPENAVACVKRGSRVFVGSGCAEPVLLVAALAERPDVEDVEVLHIMTVGQAPYAKATQTRRFRANAFFIGSNVREAVAHGAADYTPMFLSEIPGLFRTRRARLDVALVSTTLPDAHGFVSLGVSVDVVKAAVESADIVVAEVNPTMPRTHGASFVHVSDIDFFVRNDAPILESAPDPVNEVTMKIGQFCASLIDHGATLQMGIGGIPNAVLANLGDKQDLGIHSEMFSDGIIELIENGVITGRRKTLHPRKVVTSFCKGSRRLYDYVHDNPLFEFLPTEFVNDPFVIAKNNAMISINSALQVDLTGQVCADSIGTRFYSGIGGQVDFIRGAARSPGGRSIIAIESTAKGGTLSRIVPVLAEGAGVVTTRGDVHTVVTEYGIAELKGRTVRERTLSLISIAHPDFRTDLLAVARNRNLVAADQVPWPAKGRPYPVELEAREMVGGTEVFLRPLRPADEKLLREFFYSHSPETIYQRYGAPLKSLTPRQIQEQCALDYDTEMAIAGFVHDGEGERIVALGRYEFDRASGLADITFTVAENFQGRGLGTWLFQRLVKVARERGIKGFTGTVLAGNVRMMGIFHKSGEPVESRLEDGRYRVTVIFEKNRGETEPVSR
ncbi:MAG: GNAT family N-acetyltransferase [Planctomycetes bacterium]|nr:GNAT family N-acetyltransferase [Planctomycetota bacterium]